MSDTSLTSVLTNIFAAPSSAFPAIKEQPRAWLPLLLLVVAACAVSVLYTTSVDLPWLIDRTLDASGRDIPAAQREQAIAAATRLPPAVYGAFGAVGGAITLLVLFAVFALYYKIVSQFTHDGIAYKQWFGFVAWCALPGILGALATIVNLAVSDVRFMPQEEINPLSFSSLLGIDAQGLGRLQLVLVTRDLTTLWTLALSVIGYQIFTKRTLSFSATVVLVPVVCVALLGAVL